MSISRDLCRLKLSVILSTILSYQLERSSWTFINVYSSTSIQQFYDDVSVLDFGIVEFRHTDHLASNRLVLPISLLYPAAQSFI